MDQENDDNEIDDDDEDNADNLRTQNAIIELMNTE